ncbi:hypothetical protein B0E34_16465 [Chryseobacterium mucoviscidosis]|uniref:Uncharacterized protein n=2 Tax=Chryseobacterium mucoviscidosis TaxID=1945581 RepID=A0A202BWD7_9FLAO|nr:hypothetical protein B0E34_16465 [Chryseobacterium mucoviscidosis]
MVMEKISNKYWADGELFASYGYYFNNIEQNIELFIDKYLSVAIKYGINLPSLVDDCNTYDIQYLKEQYIKSDEILTRLLLRKSYSNKIEQYITISHMFLNDYNGHIKAMIYKDLDFFIKIAHNDEISVKSYYIGLQTNAFFSEIEGYNQDGNRIYVDNSELSFLNTTRLNSYIRDLTILMFEFGAEEFDFSNEYDIYDKNGISELYEDIYLKIKGEVLFYEDIYDLLPEEHKYKPFEEIQVELDDTNYKKYLENKK